MLIVVSYGHLTHNPQHQHVLGSCLLGQLTCLNLSRARIVGYVAPPMVVEHGPVPDLRATALARGAPNCETDLSRVLGMLADDIHGRVKQWFKLNLDGPTVERRTVLDPSQAIFVALLGYGAGFMGSITTD